MTTSDLANLESLRAMRHSPIRNYIIPGLTSYLIGEPSKEHGCVRMFECSREHQEHITPHSHRFDFRCLVLEGEVHNTIWTPGIHGDQFVETTMVYSGEVGSHLAEEPGKAQPWTSKTTRYGQHQWYGMSFDEVHSIRFGRGSCVLFFEGRNVSNNSTILEPFVDGQRVPTFHVAPWMFQRGVPA